MSRYPRVEGNRCAIGGRLTSSVSKSSPARDRRVAALEAQLAILSEVGQALAKQRNLDDITELVGQRLHQTFPDVGLFIALYDSVTNMISFPYEIAEGERYHTEAIPAESGLTARVIRTRAPLMYRTSEQMQADGAIDVGGSVSASWLGAPIVAGNEVIGAIGLESDEPEAFDDDDLRLVATLASSTGVALANARLFDETKRLLGETEQRNAELAVINEIGEALARQLDFQGIIDAVGNRLESIFKASSLVIGLHDETTNTISFPWEVDEGTRIHGDPIEFGKGLSSLVLQERRPFRFGNQAEQARHGGFVGTYSDADPEANDHNESWLGVPIMSGARAIGLVVLGDEEKNHFTEADERLVATIAASLGVALENARLFDETKRLLGETEQQNAELAVINEIGEALAKQLDFQGIIDAVGERIRSIFDVQSALIALYHPEAETISLPYAIDVGERVYETDKPFSGLTGLVISSRRPLRLGTAAEAQARDAVVFGAGAEPFESWLGVPVLAGDRVLGVIGLEREPKNAFSESDERLLATIASNLGVALENARLFDETKRLLAETDERAAELAIINSVQEGLAAKLDMQSMYELVGDKIRAIFDAQVVLISLYDHDTETTSYPYAIERGARLQAEPSSFSKPERLFIEERRPFLINDVAAWEAEQDIEVGVVAGEVTKSILAVPLLVNGSVYGGLSLQNIDHTNAFSEADVRLLTTLASSLSVALENARLFDETQ